MMKLGCFAIVALLFTNVQGQGNGAVRLYSNGQVSITDSLGNGIVEVYYNSKWNTVCDNNTASSKQVGNTICIQLGYAGGGSTVPYNIRLGTDPNSPGFSSVSCNDSDINFLSCDYDTTSTDCNESQYLTVQCTSSTFTFTGDVRLTGFTQYSGRGRIEANCNDEWGLICNDGFTKNDADTVCRQLGYTEAISYGKNYGSGDFSQPVWFDNPGCNSSTKCLSSCHSCPSSSFGNCSVDNVAGVTCSYNTTLPGDAGKYEHCYNPEIPDNGSIIGLVGIIFVIIFALLVCAFVIVIIPIICCCCFGVGIGAAAGAAGAAAGAASARR